MFKKTLMILAVLTVLLSATPVQALDVPIPDCLPCQAEPPAR